MMDRGIVQYQVHGLVGKGDPQSVPKVLARLGGGTVRSADHDLARPKTHLLSPDDPDIGRLLSWNLVTGSHVSGGAACVPLWKYIPVNG